MTIINKNNNYYIIAQGTSVSPTDRNSASAENLIYNKCIYYISASIDNCLFCWLNLFLHFKPKTTDLIFGPTGIYIFLFSSRLFMSRASSYLSQPKMIDSVTQRVYICIYFLRFPFHVECILVSLRRLQKKKKCQAELSVRL